MKYLLFVGGIYYPRGGWEDFRGSFKTKQAAKKAVCKFVKDRGYDAFYWWHIVDSEKQEKVEEFEIYEK